MYTTVEYDMVYMFKKSSTYTNISISANQDVQNILNTSVFCSIEFVT